ncbi:MAG TPA: carbamoyltransferase N-terminal domain-containing protein, partial [Ktedonobacteraceae bacterium]|nr:carbamoyltransferase N-terminal domain-containing protein [Ktedonobacteraceae bacterium]
MSYHSPVTVLGVSESHCATACLLRDGKVVACISEERLNRIKNWSGFPSLAVREVLRIGGVGPDEVDRLVLHGHSPWMYGWYSGENESNNKSRRLMSSRELLGKVLYRMPKAWGTYELLRNRLYRARVHRRWNQERLQLASDQSGVPLHRVVLADHHNCHAYAGLHGVLGLPDSPQLVLTCDGHGDDCCATVSTYRGGSWQRLAITPNNHSLADVYMEVT